jgi:hypothetical protein
MAAFQALLELILVGNDNGNIFVIHTELSCFGVFRKGVMHRRLYIVVIAFHLDGLVNKVTVIPGWGVRRNQTTESPGGPQTC